MIWKSGAYIFGMAILYYFRVCTLFRLQTDLKLTTV